MLNVNRKVFYPTHNIDRWKIENKNKIIIITEVTSPYRFDRNLNEVTIYFKFKEKT